MFWFPLVSFLSIRFCYICSKSKVLLAFQDSVWEDCVHVSVVVLQRTAKKFTWYTTHGQAIVLFIKKILFGDFRIFLFCDFRIFQRLLADSASFQDRLHVFEQTIFSSSNGGDINKGIKGHTGQRYSKGVISILASQHVHTCVIFLYNSFSSAKQQRVMFKFCVISYYFESSTVCNIQFFNRERRFEWKQLF